jgi:hypothetical protein
VTVRAALSIDDYRRQVIAFAENFRDFYAAAGPRQLEDWEQEFHDQFRTEFDGRLMRASSARPPR